MADVFLQAMPLQIVCSAQENSCVRLAVQDLYRDLMKVTKQAIELTFIATNEPIPNAIWIATLGQEHVEGYLTRIPIDVSRIEGREEHFLITPTDTGIAIIGSDKRGTMWGVYEYTQRFLGIDPLYLWTDHAPQPIDQIPIPSHQIIDGPKGYRFRGWFINDEDLIQGFCKKGQTDRNYRLHRDYSEMLDMLLETALRLKQNMLIPCSHLDIMRPEEEAIVQRVTERGLYITMHHIEPVGVQQRTIDTYWAERGVTENINFVDHPEKYYEVWQKYIERWSKYDDVIWQLGLRGRGDRPVWYQNERIPDSEHARGKLISDAIATQLDMIRAQCPDKNVISTTTLWMEGMPLYRAGALRIPTGTMVIQSDFGPNQMWGVGYQETPRHAANPYGLYYHLAFWGCGPHLIQGNRPEKICFNFRQAREKGDTDYVVLNVSNFREFVYGVRYEAQLTWNPENDDVANYRRAWCHEQFETSDTTELEAIYEAYYASFASMDDSMFPAQMTFNDGMARRVATKLMQIIRGSELISEDIQNKRLYDFENTDAFISYYEQATREGLARFEKVHKRALAAAACIPAHRKRFFEANMLVHIEIMCGIYGWVNALCHAAANRRSCKTNETFSQMIDEGIRKLEQILVDRRKAEFGRFENWYINDRLINVPELREMTNALRLDR